MSLMSAPDFISEMPGNWISNTEIPGKSIASGDAPRTPLGGLTAPPQTPQLHLLASLVQTRYARLSRFARIFTRSSFALYTPLKNYWSHRTTLQYNYSLQHHNPVLSSWADRRAHITHTQAGTHKNEEEIPHRVHTQSTHTTHIESLVKP